MTTPIETKPEYKPVLGQYSDEQLCGARKLARELGDQIKLQSKSESVIYCVGTFAIKLESSIKKFLATRDVRIQNIFEKLEIKHALPIQRYSWPQIERQRFPLVCIAPRLMGKTYSYLIPFVTQCIEKTAAIATDEIIKLSLDSESTTKIADDFTTIDQLISRKDKNKLNHNDDTLSEINQDEFDFNTLGQEPKGLEHTNRTTNTLNDKHDPQLEDELDTATIDQGPRFLIICSSQKQMKFVQMEIDRMKEAAFGYDAAYRIRKDKLPPLTRSIGNQHDDDKLAIRCAEAQILVCTPTSLLRSLTSGYVDYLQFKRIIYDDLDQALQLHNSEVREIIKIYIAQTLEIDDEDDIPQIIFYAQKWTELVRKLVTNVFVQKNILFASLLEASIYAKMKFELEIYPETSTKLKKLINILKVETAKMPTGSKIAIMCNNDYEAKELHKQLLQMSIQVIYLSQKLAYIELKKSTAFEQQQFRKQTMTQNVTIYVICDAALDILFEAMTDIKCLIHYSIPGDLYAFDTRFRLMYKHIDEIKDGLCTYILMDKKFNKQRLARELYDVITRSPSTLNSTKYEMRDLVNDLTTKICWRWATTGVCKLDKFGREAAMASFCPDRHSLTNLPKSNKWISQGEVKITVTNVVSPNEFYFWFEEFKEMHDIGFKTVWKEYDQSGLNFMNQIQPKLDHHKDKPNCDIPLHEIRRAQIYGVYFHEFARVDRVILLEDPELPNLTSDYDKACAYSSIQCRAFKIDYGIEVSVYLRNLFRLDRSLCHIPAQCHRGFLLGVKPNQDEPYWSYKASKFFHEKIYSDQYQDVTLWVRFNEGDCFWFEDFILSRKLYNFDGSANKTIPRCNLVQDLRELDCAKIASDPSFIEPSQRAETRSKWHTQLTACLSNYAYLRRDKSPLDLFVLRVKPDLSLYVRQFEFNKILIDLEAEIMRQYEDDKLVALQYLQVGIQCLGALWFGKKLSINRCKILEIFNEMDAKTGKSTQNCNVFCLDHGDTFKVESTKLYLMPHSITSKLPYQAIETSIADLDSQSILRDQILTSCLIESIYDLTRRPEDDELIVIKALLRSDDAIYIHIKDKDMSTLYRPILVMLENKHKACFSKNKSQDIRQNLIVPEPDESKNDDEEQRIYSQSPSEAFAKGAIKELLQELVEIELKKRIGLRHV